MSDWVIIFIVMVIALTMAGLEAERTEYDFEAGIRKIDSLWTVIQEWDLWNE